jgi:hypothetical protein
VTDEHQTPAQAKLERGTLRVDLIAAWFGTAEAAP